MGLHLRALSSRLETARSMRSASPRTSVGSSVDLEAHVAAAPGALRRRRATISSRRTSSALPRSPQCSRAACAARRRRPPAPSARRARRRCPRAGSRAPAGGRRSASLQDLDVGAQGGDRRAQLVARVGDQVALGRHRALERVERGVEAPRQARQLVAAAHLQALARGRDCRVSVSVRRVKRAIGASAVRATSAPSSAASAMPGDADRRSRISRIGSARGSPR